MKEKSLRELIGRYLNGTCSPEEKREVENWYKEAEADADILEFLSDAEKEMLRGILFKGIREKITQRIETPPPRFLWRRYAAGIAALVILGIGLVWLMNVSGLRNPAGTHDPVARVMVIANQEKSILKSALPDGSTAWLHPGSSLKYPESFDEGERRVTMSGEVFFEVQRDTLRPFIVFSGGIRTKVLGTSFRVRAYANDTYAKVSVVTGKVSVLRIHEALSGAEAEEKRETGAAAAPAEVVLAPEESVIYSGEAQSLIREGGLKDPEMTMWKRSNVSFHNTPVREVLKKLNAVYNVRIKVSEEEIGDYILRADLSGMNLPDVLEILGHSLGLSYEMDHREITLRKSVH